MISLLKVLTCALVAALLTNPALAAEALPEQQSPEGAVVAQSDQDEAATTETETDEESDDNETQEEDSPSRFIPTEQISQDLGVSFPIDI